MDSGSLKDELGPQSFYEDFHRRLGVRLEHSAEMSEEGSDIRA